MTDDDLSEKLTVGEMAQSCCGIVEGKHTIDDRPDAMLLHYAAHVLEIAAAADCDRSERSLTHEHGHEVQPAHCTPEHADHGYLAAIRDGLDRLHQRIGTTDLHHTIHATTPGERTHLIAPLGQRAIVDDMVCAKLSETPDFLGARGRCNDARAHRLGKLNGKERDSARTFREH